MKDSYGWQGIAARIYYVACHLSTSSRYGWQGIAARIYFNDIIAVAVRAMVGKESLLGYTIVEFFNTFEQAMVGKESLLGYT